MLGDVDGSMVVLGHAKFLNEVGIDTALLEDQADFLRHDNNRRYEVPGDQVWFCWARCWSFAHESVLEAQ